MSRRLRVVSAVCAAGLLVAACGGSDDADDAASTTTEEPAPETTEAPAPETTEPVPETTEAPPETTESPSTTVDPGEPVPDVGDTVTVFDLSPGDCYLADVDEVVVGQFSTCDTTGVDQVTTIIAFDGDDYPGDDEITTWADDTCLGAEPDAGIEPIGESVGWYVPLEEEWDTGIRSVWCTAYREGDFDADGNVVQPLVIGESCFTADPAGESAIGAPVDCAEPHESEYVGSVPPPFDVLPDDFDEAATGVSSACGPIVEEAVGRSPSVPGVIVGFNIPDAELGEPVEQDVECYAVGSGTDLLVGQMTEVGVEAAYGDDARILADLSAGDCFAFLGDSFDVGTIADCGDDDALIFIGSFVADAGPFPGADALRELRSERCLELLDEGPRLPVLLDSISGTIPDERAWVAQDMRTITCDGMSPTG